MTDRDILSHIKPGLTPSIRCYPSLPSTNTTLREWAEAGAPGGAGVIAEAQTAGRGRLGRSFASPVGAGLYMSLLVREAIPIGRLPLLTPYAAVAAARAIESVAELRVGIKWVNDLRVGEKKIAGILTEVGFSPSGEPAFAVVGIGINLLPGALPEELGPIAAAIGDFTLPPSREKLAAAIFNEFFGRLPSLLDGSFLSEYRRRSVVLGRTVTAIDGERTAVGVATAIEDDGALRLETEGGPLLLRAGEVSIKL